MKNVAVHGSFWTDGDPSALAHPTKHTGCPLGSALRVSSFDAFQTTSFSELDEAGLREEDEMTRAVKPSPVPMLKQPAI